MESDNNKTIVGGVTFGTSNSADVPPVAPANTMPFPSGIAEPTPAPTPVTTDPFAAAAEPAAPMAAAPDATAAPATPAPAEPVAATPAPVPVADPLSDPLVAAMAANPTPVDLQSLVNSVTDPSEIAEGEEAEKKKKKQNADQAVKKFSTIALVTGILAVIFLVFGVVGLVSSMKTSSDLSETKEELATKSDIIKAVEQSAGLAEGTIVSPETVPVYKATTGYIYISEWGIKIKIPNNLEKVSYILNQNYRPYICFNAVQKGVQYFPDFANVVLNPGGMGCLTRIATTEGKFDAATGRSFGDIVYTYKDYSYFYTPGHDYSSLENDAANLDLEHTAQNIIKNMLTDNIEQYE